MDAQTFVTLKVGETYSSRWGSSAGSELIGGNAIAVDMKLGPNADILGVQPGYSIYGYYDNNGAHKALVFNVLDVIPSEINLVVGGNYVYSPVAVSNSKNNYAYKTFTWTSNNTSVATVDASGKVNAVAPGKATITCTANCGNSFSSVVCVTAQQTQQVKLNTSKQDLEVGNTVSLTAIISPDNTTKKAVKWLSTNENIAQVDNEGNVTAIAPGYCSIFCIADDGSKKYDKCLVHVQGESASRADVNGDGNVSVTDAFSVIDVILNQ